MFPSLFRILGFCGLQNNYLLVLNFIEWVHTSHMFCVFNYSLFDSFGGVRTPYTNYY